MASVAPQAGPTLNAKLTVKPFLDKRREHQPAETFTAKKNPVLIEGKELCINLERGYAGNVPEELASVVERHVARRRVLAARDANSVDYELEGSILVFYGLRVRSDTKTVDTTLMGLPGAVIDEHTAKARGRVVVAFSDLRLHNLQDGTSKPLEAVGVNVKGDSFSGGCNSIFKHVDNKLQEVVETLSIQIEETIRTWPEP